MSAPEPTVILDIYPHDVWLFALCALSTKRNARGDILIGNIEKISEILRNLDRGRGNRINLFIAMKYVPGGLFSEDVARWIGALEMRCGPNAIVADVYEKDCFMISPKVELALLNSVSEKVRFADRGNGEFRAVMLAADALRQVALLDNISKSLDQMLGQMYDTEKDIELLRVLIPLACMSYCNFDNVMIHPGIGLEINRHRTGCHFCKKYLEMAGLRNRRD